MYIGLTTTFKKNYIRFAGKLTSLLIRGSVLFSLLKFMKSEQIWTMRVRPAGGWAVRDKCAAVVWRSTVASSRGCVAALSSTGDGRRQAVEAENRRTWYSVSRSPTSCISSVPDSSSCPTVTRTPRQSRPCSTAAATSTTGWQPLDWSPR